MFYYNLKFIILEITFYVTIWLLKQYKYVRDIIILLLYYFKKIFKFELGF